MKTYIAIDLKSFYASVECIERGLDPMNTNLVVADNSRTSKTICLAVTPPLKKLGVPSRPRLFEVEQRVRYLNALRRKENGYKDFRGKSFYFEDLKKDPSLELDYIIASPRMAYYMDYSRKIYQIYLKYVAPEDIHVYSIDEVFMDASNYLKSLKLSDYDFTKSIIREIENTTGITATAGIGSNLYLAKVAMDIRAKHIVADEDGVRIAKLNEISYREHLWDHRPLTDFWRVGRGYAKKLHSKGVYTMGDIAKRSLEEEEIFYKMFGVNAELLIDHAWGIEPCTIEDIKSYRPRSSSLGSGQVLHRPYPYEEAKIVVWEMGDQLALDLVSKGYVTNQLSLRLSFDILSLEDPQVAKRYRNKTTQDAYGRTKPKSVNGSRNLPKYSSSSKMITQALLGLLDSLMDKDLLVRKVTVTANHTCRKEDIPKEDAYQQLDLFGSIEKAGGEERWEERERKLQETILKLKRKFGKNSIMKGANMQEGATGRERNSQIGGHKA